MLLLVTVVVFLLILSTYYFYRQEEQYDKRFEELAPIIQYALKLNLYEILLYNKLQMVKVFHLSVDDIKSKIQKLQNQIDSEQVKNNKTKRKRLYHQLAGLKKALQKPEDLVVDPEQQKKKIQQQKHRRIQKKIDKKRQIILSVKKQKRYKKRCLKCGSWQHLLSECQTNKGGGYCYKCGSQDHNHKDCSKQTYDLADCFYCGKKGHIARQCPTNQKGLYRKGGSCFSCGSVRHILKDCPVRNAARVKTGTFQNNQEF